MKPYKKDWTIRGPIFHFKTRNLEYIADAFVTVRDGKIISVKEGEGRDADIALKKGQFLCPGMIDLHIHAPQYPNIGLGSDLTLLDWLEKYTFPLEVKYSDKNFAREIYKMAAMCTLNNGTTTACYHATVNTDSTLELCKLLNEIGQRAIVGKVSMNQNSPEWYCESTEESVKATRDFVERLEVLKMPLVVPSVTPRFAIACSMDLMKKLGTFATEKDLYVQTHISENQSEVEFCKQLFPDCKSYTDVYLKSDLLNSKTILAHGVYLSDNELKLISEKGSCIAHCPNSNTFLKSGLCDVRRLWKHNVNVGLGTDVSGGCNASIIDSMRSALTTSIHLSFSEKNYEPLTYQDAFYLATLGGAQALHMEKTLGSIEVGKDFDALIVDMNQSSSGICCGLLDSHSDLELLQKFVYCSDSRNIHKVFVQGRLVKEL